MQLNNTNKKHFKTWHLHGGEKLTTDRVSEHNQSTGQYMNQQTVKYKTGTLSDSMRQLEPRINSHIHKNLLKSITLYYT